MGQGNGTAACCDKLTIGNLSKATTVGSRPGSGSPRSSGSLCCGETCTELGLSRPDRGAESSQKETNSPCPKARVKALREKLLHQAKATDATSAQRRLKLKADVHVEDSDASSRAGGPEWGVRQQATSSEDDTKLQEKARASCSGPLKEESRAGGLGEQLEGGGQLFSAFEREGKLNEACRSRSATRRGSGDLPPAYPGEAAAASLAEPKLRTPTSGRPAVEARGRSPGSSSQLKALDACDPHSVAPSLPDPNPHLLMCRDPRSAERVGLIAFYFPGREEAWDKTCGAAFLGNFWDLGPGGLKLEAKCCPGHRMAFSNAESAFRALRFWPRADQFRSLAGLEALQLERKLQGSEDETYAGFGSSWNGMLAVLHAKFQPGSACAGALLKTQDAYLLQHNALSGRDRIWSDNHIGDGTNWLGLQLMLVRDELMGEDSKPGSWTDFATNRCRIDLKTGEPQDAGGCEEWQRTVQSATETLLQRFPAAAICLRPGCGKLAWNRMPGEYCSVTCRKAWDP